MAMLLIGTIVGCETMQTKQGSATLVTDDQIKLDFDYYPAHQINSPTVILLPDTRCDRRNYGNFSAWLNEAGFGVMAIDFSYKNLIERSGNESKQIETIKRQNLDVLVDPDVKSAMDFLAREDSVDHKRICIIGTSLGSRVALKSGVNYNIKALVLISLSDQEIFTVGSTPIQKILSKYRDKPIFFMTSEGDWGNNFRAAEDN